MVERLRSLMIARLYLGRLFHLRRKATAGRASAALLLSSGSEELQFSLLQSRISLQSTLLSRSSLLDSGTHRRSEWSLECALSIAVQRRIEEILDRAEALRARRRVAIAQLDTLGAT